MGRPRSPPQAMRGARNDGMGTPTWTTRPPPPATVTTHVKGSALRSKVAGPERTGGGAAPGRSAATSACSLAIAASFAAMAAAAAARFLVTSACSAAVSEGRLWLFAGGEVDSGGDERTRRPRGGVGSACWTCLSETYVYYSFVIVVVNEVSQPVTCVIFLM